VSGCVDAVAGSAEGSLRTAHENEKPMTTPSVLCAIHFIGSLLSERGKA
jgi:hypothetical protein